MARQRVLLAMSGGVDSSVAAHLLVEQGHDVVGVFMRTGAHADEAAPATGKARGCCSAVDAADARHVADQLDIPFHALNFEQEFARIQDYFADEYLKARTPNPCVVCNTWLKFGKLFEYADAIGAGFVATGHYARRTDEPDGPGLCRAVDPTKDQSYFLFGLNKDRLGRVLFPIGDLNKPDVREIARRQGLGVHDKPDSQEVCFVPDGDYQGFVARRRPGQAEPGEIVDHATGKVLGQHRGVSGFTIGQRKGLGVAVGEPRYVLAMESEQNRVIIGPQELLRRDSFTADRVNWLLAATPSEPIACEVKIRYLHRPTPATVTPLPEGRARIAFEQPQSAVTPGQATVFYQGDRVLGGGWIEG